MAQIERLAPFTDLQLIDNIVIKAGGAYDHDRVFEMDLDFVYNLTLMHYEQDMFQKRYSLFDAEVNKPKTKTKK